MKWTVQGVSSQASHECATKLCQENLYFYLTSTESYNNFSVNMPPDREADP